MAYHQHQMSATYVPGMDDYYHPPPGPDLVAPEPQRVNPEIGNQMHDTVDAVQRMDLNSRGGRGSLGNGQHAYTSLGLSNDEPHLSAFPKLNNPPPNVPPSDEELERTLENARQLVLTSNDPEMQLAWAADALVYVGVCADNEERISAAKPVAARSSTPRVEHQLKVDAMNIVTFLANQHHPKAEFLRGMWLEWGRFGQREDKREAFRCYSRAADRGYARAEYRIGMLYESYNDPIKALRHYHRGVDAGDAASCYRLGMMTLRGQHGQQQDYKTAIDLIRKSAEAADENAAQGAYVYGMLLARQLPQIEVPDQFLAFDERAARMNIEKAAYLKFSKAQLKMGSAYELGSLGCEFNPALSMHYNALASKQGEAEADMALSKWFLVGSEGLFPKNEELAYTYAERASQSGLATAEFALGYFHEIGVYVPVNLDQAMEWYSKASKHGNADAAGRIAGLSKKQALSRRDHEDIAISRIKSQHGSMRGVRPDRFRQQPQPSKLGQVAETPSGVYSSNNETRRQSQPSMPVAGGVPPPARGTTPYPEDNGPPKLDNIPPARGTTPYPLDDGPPKPPPGQQRLGPAGGFFNVPQQPPRPSTTLNPTARPSSAFQIAPDLRSSSVAQPPLGTGQSPYFGGRPPYAGGLVPQPNYRPATVQPYDPRGRPPPGPLGGRVASGPPNMQAFPTQQNVPPPAPSRLSQQSTPVPARPPLPPPNNTAPTIVPQQQTQPLVDIGFSAPADNSRRRQYGPGSNLVSANQPQTPITGPQHANTMPNFDQPAPLRPNKPPDSKAAGQGKPLPSKPQSSSAVPLPEKLPEKSSKPGKGPKTFDEMGVPQTKQDSDCTIM